MNYYFDSKLNCNNLENNGEPITGLCTSMCPDDEVILRTREKMVHILEVWGSERKLIKSYSRSAADANMIVPKRLRPFPVLLDTVQYILSDVIKRPDVSQVIVYEFINDRLRAVRQDMTIQRLLPDQCTTLLEPMIRFYVYYGYKLSEWPIRDFDPVMNNKYLLECLKWFLSCSNQIDSSRKIQVDDLLRGIQNLNISSKKPNFVCDRILIECLYILCNLDDPHPLFSHPALQLAYKIAIANLQGNFVLVTKLLKRLSPLTYCAVFLHLPAVQKRAIATLSVAYSSARLTVPAATLRRWLHVAADSHVAELCSHYGLTAENGAVHLVKNKFNNALLMRPMKNSTFENSLNMDIDYILTYTS